MKKPKKTPMRMCVACQTMKPKRELVRVVAGEDGMHIDETGKMPGRGAYLCRSETCLEKALKERRLERAVHCPVTEPVAARLREELVP